MELFKPVWKTLILGTVAASVTPFGGVGFWRRGKPSFRLAFQCPQSSALLRNTLDKCVWGCEKAKFHRGCLDETRGSCHLHACPRAPGGRRHYPRSTSSLPNSLRWVGNARYSRPRAKPGFLRHLSQWLHHSSDSETWEYSRKNPINTGVLISS